MKEKELLKEKRERNEIDGDGDVRISKSTARSLEWKVTGMAAISFEENNNSNNSNNSNETNSPKRPCAFHWLIIIIFFWTGFDFSACLSVLRVSLSHWMCVRLTTALPRRAESFLSLARREKVADATTAASAPAAAPAAPVNGAIIAGKRDDDGCGGAGGFFRWHDPTDVIIISQIIKRIIFFFFFFQIPRLNGC